MQISPTASDVQWLEVIGVVGAAIAWLYHWRVTRFRSRLKDDLEILSRYAALRGDSGLAEDPHYHALLTHVERTMYLAYERPGIPWARIWGGVVVLAIGVLNFVVERPPSIAAIVAGTMGILVGSLVVIGAAVLHSKTRNVGFE